MNGETFTAGGRLAKVTFFRDIFRMLDKNPILLAKGEEKLSRSILFGGLSTWSFHRMSYTVDVENEN